MGFVERLGRSRNALMRAPMICGSAPAVRNGLVRLVAFAELLQVRAFCKPLVLPLPHPVAATMTAIFSLDIESAPGSGMDRACFGDR